MGGGDGAADVEEDQVGAEAAAGDAGVGRTYHSPPPHEPCVPQCPGPRGARPPAVATGLMTMMKVRGTEWEGFPFF